MIKWLVRVQAIAVGLMLVAGCEPASITEAKDQLRRGPARSVTLAVPVARDSFGVGDVLEDIGGLVTVTLPSGVLGVAMDRDSLEISSSGLVGGTVTGILDPTLLTYDVEASREIPAAALSLGELENVIRDATLHTAPIGAAVENTADAPMTLTDFALGLVRIDLLTGNPRRDPTTNEFEYETEAGAPILIPVADPGVNTLALGRQATVNLTLDGAPLVDRLVDLLIDGVRTAIVGAGTVSIGDGTIGTVGPSDRIVLRVDPVVGFDLTVPAGGVSFDSSLAVPGLDLDADVTEEIIALLDSAAVDLAVTNATPFAVEATTAFVAGSVAGDVFATPGRVDVAPLIVSAPAVSDDGIVLEPLSDFLTVALAPGDLLPLLGAEFTAGVRIRLLPPVGGRGALRATDYIRVRAGARIVYHTGGAP